MSTINVNLKPCERHHLPLDKSDPAYHVLPGTGNLGRCEAPPVLLPCPLPRSVEFMVRLGECDCPPPLGHGAYGHAPSCAAHLIRVTCTIGGETWAGSEVEEVEMPESIETDPARGQDRVALEAACRKLWALVKALVLRLPPLDPMTEQGRARLLSMLGQRDAMFAALADMARCERNAWAAQERAVSVLDEWHSSDWHKNPDTQADVMPSTSILARYVEHLIGQVGGLS